MARFELVRENVLPELARAANTYRSRNGQLPRSVSALVEARVIERDARYQLTDPWGGAYVIEPRNGLLRIASLGGDGAAGGTDGDADSECWMADTRPIDDTLRPAAPTLEPVEEQVIRLLAAVLALGLWGSSCRTQTNPVTHSEIVGDYRIAIRGFGDGLVVSADGGFLHCWDVDGGQQWERGGWTLSTANKHTGMDLDKFTDLRSIVLESYAVRHGALVTRSGGRIHIELAGDDSDYFYKLEPGTPGCVER
jgi:hypothetical protein